MAQPLATRSITIHKSQGLTFEHAVIDAQAAFAFGQVYVVLSRCKSVEGMVFSSSYISATAIHTDHKVLRFVRAAAERAPSADDLSAAKIAYQQRLLHECFDFQDLGFRLDRLVRLVLGNSNAVKILGLDDRRGLADRCQTEVCVVGERFRKQLAGIFAAGAYVQPDSHPRTLERIAKAAVATVI